MELHTIDIDLGKTVFHLVGVNLLTGKVSPDCLTKWNESAAHSIIVRSLCTNKGRIHLRGPTCYLILRLRQSGGPYVPGRVGPGNFIPSPSQKSGLEPLDSSGSCHRMRAAALRQNRRAPPVSSWPIMVSTPIACPLRSTVITPLHHYYQAVRPSAPHPYSRPRGSIHLWLLRLHRCQGSHVPYVRLF
jgi:hypothetical protein